MSGELFSSELLSLSSDSINMQFGIINDAIKLLQKNQLITNELNSAKASPAQQATNTADIATNAVNIDTNKSDIATNTSDIATNKSDIATNKSDIATNTSDIATNKSDIATNKSDIATNTGGLNALGVQVNDLNGGLNALGVQVNDLNNGLDAIGSQVNDLNNGLDAIGSQVNDLKGDVENNAASMNLLALHSALIPKPLFQVFGNVAGPSTAGKLTSWGSPAIDIHKGIAVGGVFLYGWDNTNSHYRCPLAGYYRASAIVTWIGYNVTNRGLGAHIYKNNSSYGVGPATTFHDVPADPNDPNDTGAPEYQFASLNYIVECNQGDTLHVHSDTESGVNLQMERCTFSVEFLDVPNTIP